MAEELLLGIDIGTSGCKTIAVNQEGHVVAKEIEDYPLYSPKHGWAEQNPAEWWMAVEKTIKKIVAHVKDNLQNIRGIGLSGQMHGLVALNKNYEVIRPSILWNDQRTEKQCAYIYDKVGGLPGLLNITNNKMLPGYTGGKILWVQDNEPQHYEKIHKIVNPKDYIRFRLTGEIATEVSDASGTGLFDVKNRVWSRKLIDILGIPFSWFPTCYESKEISGRISDHVADSLGLPKNLPVVGGGGDAVIQTIGTGVTSGKILMTTIGTAGIISTALDRFITNPEGKLQIFCNVIPSKWHAMGVTLAAGGSLKWAKETFGESEAVVARELNEDVYAIISEEVEQTSPGADGLIFLPYLQGERCPHADPHARGAFIGLSATSRKNAIYRSIMEGVIFSFRDVADLFSQAGMDFDYIATSGGGAQSETWVQIHADIFKKTVLTVNGSREGAAYGAVIVAGVGLGVWADFDEAVEHLKVETSTEPNPVTFELYDRYFSVYKSYYSLLKESYKLMGDI